MKNTVDNGRDGASRDPMDDPRITAYALGELGEEERAEVERQLAKEDALRREVNAIEALGGSIALRSDMVQLWDGQVPACKAYGWQLPRLLRRYISKQLGYQA